MTYETMFYIALSVITTITILLFVFGIYLARLNNRLRFYPYGKPTNKGIKLLIDNEPVLPVSGKAVFFRSGKKYIVTLDPNEKSIANAMADDMKKIMGAE